MESWVVHLLVEGGLALFAGMLKMTVNDLKMQVNENRHDIDNVKEKYFKKEDFQDFKRELWQRLDRFEQDVKDQINSK